MTGIALGARDGFAFLLTDAGVFGAGGKVLELRRKLISVERHNLVLAASGIALDWLEEELEARAEQAATTPAFVRSLVPFAEEIREALALPGVEFAMQDMPKLTCFYGALFDRQLDAAVAFMVLPAGGRLAAPFERRQVTTAFQPSAISSRWPGNSFDPARDAAEAMELMRSVPAYGGASGIAGWGDLAIVSAKGIEVREVIRWPDKLGRPVKRSELALG